MIPPANSPLTHTVSSHLGLPSLQLPLGFRQLIQLTPQLPVVGLCRVHCILQLLHLGIELVLGRLGLDGLDVWKGYHLRWCKALESDCIRSVKISVISTPDHKISPPPAHLPDPPPAAGSSTSRLPASPRAPLPAPQSAVVVRSSAEQCDVLSDRSSFALPTPKNRLALHPHLHRTFPPRTHTHTHIRTHAHTPIPLPLHPSTHSPNPPTTPPPPHAPLPCAPPPPSASSAPTG